MVKGPRKHPGASLLRVLVAAAVATTLPALAAAQEDAGDAEDRQQAPAVRCEDGDAVRPGSPDVPWADTTAAAAYLSQQLGVDAPASADPDSVLRRGGEAFRAGHHTVAFVAYRTVAEGRDGFEALWKTSRAAVDVGQDVPDSDEADRWYGLGEDYARRALEENAERPEGHLHLAQALGLVALNAGVRERVKLSKEIREEALATIDADSSYAGGWHVLGRWHKGVMELPSFGRFFARTFLGGEVLGEASWEKAAQYLRRAAELEPDRIVHPLELGKVYRQTESPERAREQLQKVLELPARDRHDCVYKAQARELLQEMEG